MSRAALERLNASYEALIRALDGTDVESIARASADLAEAVEQVRSADLRADPAARASLSRLVALGYAAQTRVNFMTDALKRRLGGLAAVRGELSAATYQPGTR
jgi:hypothetical protein